MEKDTYRTLSVPSAEILFKDKNSKFYGYSFPVSEESEVKQILENLRKQHFSARHFCYAFKIGTENFRFRANDDGEPNNSAGMPIYGQILSFELTNVLVVVVRYFGGVKLGVGGLISAYKTSAQMALEEAGIIEKTLNIHFLVKFSYQNMDKVMSIIKEKNLEIVSQNMTESCEIEISVRKRDAKNVETAFENLYEIGIKVKE